MQKKMGRPPKITTEEKIAIINRYYISRTGEHPDAIGAHGIYQKLATFSKELGYQLEAYDFSRDETTRAYIAKFAKFEQFAPVDISKHRIERRLYV